MNSPFKDPAILENLPSPISEAARAMMIEIEVSGEHSTADETALLIENVLTYIGRLWVAEYLNADHYDDNINSRLMTVAKSNMTVGQWVALSRVIQNRFVELGIETVIDGLKGLDFGAPSDPTNTITRLVSFRNNFSHGSMGSVIEDIRTHRFLIGKIVKEMPALWRQRPIFFSKQHRVWVHATGMWSVHNLLPDFKLDSLQPVILSTDGKQCLRLYPLFYISETENGYTWNASSPKNRQVPFSRLFEIGRMKAWAERYEHERLGNLDTQTDFLSSTKPKIPAQLLTKLVEAVHEKNTNLIVINAFPGCEKANALHAVYNHFCKHGRKSNFASNHIYRVHNSHLSQSGITFAYYIIRQIEKTLAPTNLGVHDQKIPPKILLENALDTLKKSKKRILICIENLHLGVNPFRGESLSIVDVYNSLSGSNVTFVVTVLNQYVKDKLFYDKIFSLPIPDKKLSDQRELSETIITLCSGAPIIRERILRCLLEKDSPLSLFEMCEKLEKFSEEVFEPEVEHHLWRLAPVLVENFSISKQQKQWRLFHKDCRTVISNDLAKA